MSEFIGLENLKHIAEQFTPTIIMGAVYYRPEELTRMGIQTVSGVQFKRIDFVLVRKGGTTRKKKVGDELNNKVGYLEERTLEAHLTWNRFRDNIDNYVESAVVSMDASTYTYPLSVIAFQAATATYGEDIFNNLWFGNSLATNESMSLFDGFHTYLAHDMDNGDISVGNRNLIEMNDSFAAPTSNTDMSAWILFRNTWNKTSKGLRSAQTVMCYMSIEVGINISDAYSNAHYGNSGVIYTGDGNFKFPEIPNLICAPSADYGEGQRLIFTLPNNFQYGVDSLDSRNKTFVQMGSDLDAKDVFFQIESIQGVRVKNIQPGSFAMTNGNIIAVTESGDYTKEVFVATSNDVAKGTVTAKIGAVAVDPTSEQPSGTIITLTATPAEGHTFTMWNDGNTANPRSYVTTGKPVYITGVFA